MIRPPLCLAFTLIAAIAVTAAARPAPAGDRERVRITRTDEAASKRFVLTRSDLGTATGWKGGFVKADIPLTTPCPGDLAFDPTESDVIVSGAAEADFKNTGIAFYSSAQVVQTVATARAAWRRWAVPGFLRCLRSSVDYNRPGFHAVSVTRLPFPAVGSFVAAYRTIYTVSSSAGTPGRYVEDLLLISSGRARISLTAIYPIASSDVAEEAAVVRGEIGLAQTLSRRATAGTA